MAKKKSVTWLSQRFEVALLLEWPLILLPFSKESLVGIPNRISNRMGSMDGAVVVIVLASPI